jgi:hypothetical protein
MQQARQKNPARGRVNRELFFLFLGGQGLAGLLFAFELFKGPVSIQVKQVTERAQNARLICSISAKISQGQGGRKPAADFFH